MAEPWPLTTDSDETATPGYYIDGDELAVEIDVDNILAVIRQHLVWPAPIRDKALEEG